MSEDGRKQQAKLKELAHIAEKLSCTLPQLAIGKGQYEHPKTLNFPFLWERTKKMFLTTKFSVSLHTVWYLDTAYPNSSYPWSLAWCLRNEGVSSVLLGSSNPSQLTENLGAIQVWSLNNVITISLFGLVKQQSFFVLCTQVIPKMTAGIASEVDHILGNRPHSKKDYHH